MSNFICPVCGKPLIIKEKILSCTNKHNFDKAKSGYTNLLMSQQIKAKHHGDDKLMVRSRQAFLNRGYYNPLLSKICDMIKKYVSDGSRILDAGCGECWYTANIYEYLVNNKIKPIISAIDISKDALTAGAKRNKDIELAVASVFKLPVKTNSCDILLSLFAPYCNEEAARVLKKDGVLLRVFPLEKHLLSLKTVVYDQPYENEIEIHTLDGFLLLEKAEIRNKIRLSCNEDIINLFTMTPYYYKTCADDQKKLQALSSLDAETEFGILIYRKL
ncbi:MAG: methyltransferase [Firmicutes bacterium HGW-Firmicutes-21]|nr:MAG: methyltransferase [Firmicutes bacterium HGW-Firmicutes-21]